MAQELIWENKIPLSNYESFNCVAKTSDGGYLALGTTEKWRILNPVLGGAIIMKFDENGDTLWTKFTGYYGGFNKVIKGEDGLYYALFGYWEIPTSRVKRGIYVFNENGQFFNMIPIQTSGSSAFRDMEFKEGYIWLSGEKNPSLFYPGSLTFDFLLTKLRMEGTEVFSFAYNGSDQTSRGEKMEFMPNGNILFSGSVGNKIGAFEIDTAGNQIQYRTYFTNNFNGGWQNAIVKQIPGGNRLAAGGRSTTPTSYYMGKHDTLGNQIWGGFALGGLSEPMIFTDGSIIHINNRRDPDYCLIRKISSDSTVLWSFDFIGAGLIQGRKGIYDVFHETDSSGVCVGSIISNPGGQRNLYIAKFAKLGILYNSNAPKVLEKLKTDAQPIPFPNPGTNLIKFTILASPGKVSFTDMQG